MTEQVACLVKLENLGGWHTAAGGRVEYRTLFVVVERIRTSMHNPNVILTVNGDPRD
jgi:hypothetical protein